VKITFITPHVGRKSSKEYVRTWQMEPLAPATLATMATRGGGPPFHKFGAHVLYRWGDALAWAQSRLSAPRRNTSEGDAMCAIASLNKDMVSGDLAFDLIPISG